MFENVTQNLKMVERTSVMKTAPSVGPAQVKEPTVGNQTVANRYLIAALESCIGGVQKMLTKNGDTAKRLHAGYQDI